MSSDIGLGSFIFTSTFAAFSLYNSLLRHKDSEECLLQQLGEKKSQQVYPKCKEGDFMVHTIQNLSAYKQSENVKNSDYYHILRSDDFVIGMEEG